MQYMRAQFKKHHYSPEWVDGTRVAYHKYGLKYLALLLALSAYSFLGAGVFLFFEKPAEVERVSRRQRTFEDLRQSLIRQLLDNLFNDTEKPIIFVDAAQVEAISQAFSSGLRAFEEVIAEYNSKHSMEPLLRWDLWTALIYAWTVMTTIDKYTTGGSVPLSRQSVADKGKGEGGGSVVFAGPPNECGYGHLFPLTVGGRIATMLYAVVGIPLMLTVLSNVGKLLTKGVKYPFFILKRWGRRIFRYCTKMTKEDILGADAKDKANLDVFDLPIPVAIILVIGWIFICSAITLIWEKDWDYLVAFYFFFISLSTIGFGDVIPNQPYYLLLMFGNTMIGMALLSMLLTLIQGKLEPIAIVQERDPFEMDRLGLRRALRRASKFTNAPWLTAPHSSGLTAAALDHGPQNGGGNVVITEQRASVDGIRKVAKRRSSSAVTGGAAFSALSSFLAPLFSILSVPEEKSQDETPLEKAPATDKSPGEKESSSRPVEGHDELTIIDEDEKAQSSAKADQQSDEEEEDAETRFKPLKKTVGFQASELASSIDSAYEYPDHLIRTSQYIESPALLSSIPPPAVRALAVIEPRERSSVRLRRMEPALTVSLDRPKKKKKRRTTSMREERRRPEKLKGFSSNDVCATENGAHDAKGDHQSRRVKHREPSKHRPLSTSTSLGLAEPVHFDTLPSRKISSSTLPPAEPVNSRGAGHRRRLRRAGTAPENKIDHPMALEVSHSTCSICSYHPVATEFPDSRGHRVDKKKHSKRRIPSQKTDPWPRDLTPAANKDSTLLTGPQFQNLRIRGERQKAPGRLQRGLATESAIDDTLDTLPNDESALFARLDTGDVVLNTSYHPDQRNIPYAYHPSQARYDYPWHRHSISTDAVPDFLRSNTLPLLAQSSKRCYLSSAPSSLLMRNSETQTMISFPSQDSDSRISISGERGTARLLPESASFTEINRLVDLNINAEILRNELTALTVLGAATGDISAYERVLSLQELIDQVNHEASLPRGLQRYQSQRSPVAFISQLY